MQLYLYLLRVAEKVTNGDFATDSDWSLKVQDGLYQVEWLQIADGTQSANTDLSQNITTDTGKQYKITSYCI